jgi:translation initiation factor 4G
LAVLRRGDDDDAPAPSSPAPDRFLLARSGGKQNLMMSEVDGLELLERLRVEYAAKHHRAKLTYTLSVLRDIKENIRHELTSALFPQGMKSHKLLPVGGRKVITEDDPISKAKKFFTSILNKLSRDNYNKLVVDLIKYDIKSQEMLTAIINTVFDKALEDLKYQDIYADLCKLLGDKAQEWSKNYLRVNELDDKQAPAGPGWYYDLSGGLSIQDGEWQGPFPSKDEAQDKGFRISNFKRLILNRCQIEFYREDQNLTAQEEEQDEAQKAARGTSMTAAEIEEFRVRALRRKEVRKANKKRMLSNIAFIGQLYMTGMLTSTILYMCCGKLLNAGKTPESYVPDPDDIEALCRLLTLSGGKLEVEEKNKQKEGKESEKMSPLFSLLQQIIDAHPKLESRSRFLVKDLFDLRANKWELTGSASTIERQAKTVTLAEAKALILKEEEAEKSKLMSFVDSGSKGSYNNAGLGTSARQQVMRGDSRSGNGGGGGGGGGGRGDQHNNPQEYRNQQRKSGPASTLGQRGKGPVASANPATSEGSSEQDSWQVVPLKGGKVLSQSSRDEKASISTTPLGSIQSPPSTPSSSSSESVLSPTAPASLVLKTVVLSGDALLKHVSSVLLEFCRIMDADELIRSVTEVSSSLNYARILVQGAFIDAVKSDVARNNAGKAIVTLASKGLVQRENIVAGLASFMMSYADLVSDAPKISDYTASVSFVLLLFFLFSFELFFASDDRHILTPLVRGLWVYEHKSCLNLSDARPILKNYVSHTLHHY